MKAQSNKYLAAFSTLCLGIIISFTDFLSIVSVISLVFLFGAPISFLGAVFYQGMILKNGWKPFSGKALLAALLWFFPSNLCVLLNSIYWAAAETNENSLFQFQQIQFFAEFTTIVFLTIATAVYCSFGIGLFFWVKRTKIRDHFLLREEKS